MPYYYVILIISFVIVIRMQIVCSAWNGCIVFKTKYRIYRCTNLVPVGRHHSQYRDYPF